MEKVLTELEKKLQEKHLLKVVLSYLPDCFLCEKKIYEKEPFKLCNICIKEVCNIAETDRFLYEEVCGECYFEKF